MQGERVVSSVLQQAGREQANERRRPGDTAVAERITKRFQIGAEAVRPITLRVVINCPT